MENLEYLYTLLICGLLMGLMLGAWVVYALFKYRVLTPGKHPRDEWPFASTTAAAHRHTERGNMMFALFGSVALVGVVGASSMTILKGPVRTMAEVTKHTIAENNMIASTKLAVMAATNQAGGGDCDGDLFIEPIPADDPNGAPAPAGGGLLPVSIGASLQDPWGNRYALCSWDHGPDTGRCGGKSGLIAGAPTQDQYVLAVISAGPDRQFQTSCNAWADADTNGQPDVPLLAKVPGSDDIVLGYTYAEANTAGGGLWVLKGGDPDKATIGKDLEVRTADDSGVAFALDRSTGQSEFLAVKTDNIFARTSPNGRIILNDPLQMQKVSGLDAPAGGGGGGGGGGAGDNLGNHTATEQLSLFKAAGGSGLTVAETDPKVGAVTNNKLCRGDGTKIICDQDEPDSKVGAVTDNKWCRGDGSKVICDQDAPAGGGTVPSGTWCGLATKASESSCATNSYYTSQVTCNGTNVISGCPSGYTQRSIQTSDSTYLRCIRTCTKS